MATITQYDDFYFAETVCAKTITAPPTDGAIVVAFVRTTTTAVSSITDNQSGTYTLDHSRVCYNGTTTLDVYRRSNIDNAPTQVTVTFDTSGNYRIFLSVVDGMTAGDATPTVTSQADTTGGTTHAAEFTTVRADDIGFTYWSQSSGEVMTAPGGWTVINGGGGTNDGARATTTGASGAKSISYTAAGYTITQFNTLTYPVAGAGGQTVTSVTGSNVTEASSIVFDIAMSGSGDSTHAYAWGGTATSADYTQTLTTPMCSVVTGTGTVTVTGSNVFVPGTATAIRITVPTTTDTLDEDGETVTLTLGGTVSNTVTIADDDVEPSITGTTSATVDAGDPVVITYTLSAVSGRTITRTLTVTDGTATGGGVDYTSTINDGMFATTSGSGTVTISGSTVTIPAGVLVFTLTIPTTA